MKTLLNGSEVSKQMKKELNAAFPGIKFSVRYSSYSGGDSIRASWKFGPTVAEVEKIINKYQAGKFDGMTDTYHHSDTTIISEAGEVAYLGGVKFVFAEREINEQFKLAICAAVCANYKIEFNGFDTFVAQQNEYASTLAYRILRKASFKTESPVFNALIHLPIGAGFFEDFYKVAVSEVVNGEVICTDAKQEEINALRAELKETETRLYQVLGERDQYSAKFYNTLRELEEEKKKRLQPHIINTEEKRLFVANGIYANLNKQNTLEEYRQEITARDYYTRKTKICAILCVTDEAHEFISNNLLSDFDFLKGQGGTDSDLKLPAEYENNFTALYNNKELYDQWQAQSYNLGVLVYHPTKELFLIDPQGYNYARYVALLPEETQQELREYVENSL